MNENNLFKSSNTVVAINLTRDVMGKLNQIACSNLSKIHIMVYDVEEVNISLLRVLIEYVRRNRKKLVVHVFSLDDWDSILDEIYNYTGSADEDRYFYFELMPHDGEFIVYPSKSKMLVFRDKQVDVVNYHRIGNFIDKIEVQSISYVCKV